MILNYYQFEMSGSAVTLAQDRVDDTNILMKGFCFFCITYDFRDFSYAKRVKPQRGLAEMTT